jgi:hypothetical protein
LAGILEAPELAEFGVVREHFAVARAEGANYVVRFGVLDSGVRRSGIEELGESLVISQLHEVEIVVRFESVEGRDLETGIQHLLHGLQLKSYFAGTGKFYDHFTGHALVLSEQSVELGYVRVCRSAETHKKAGAGGTDNG